MLPKLDFIDLDTYKNFDTTGFELFFGDIWKSDSPIFDVLIDHTKPSIIIEVGSWLGSSAIHMAESIKNNNLDSKIICVDTWLGSSEHLINSKWRKWLNKRNGYPQIYYQFLFNVITKELQNQIIPFPNTSTIAARIFRKHNIKAELIYIDASHEKSEVIKDLECYFPLLSDTGIMFGDDYNWMGVRPALEIFSKKRNIKYDKSNDHNFWIIDKCTPTRSFVSKL